MSQLRVPFVELESTLHRATLHLGLTGDRAALCARLFAETTRDGVYTHGLNRFPRFAQMVANGSIDVHAEPDRVSRQPPLLERWDGHLGPGNLNAHASMQRAIDARPPARPRLRRSRQHQPLDARRQLWLARRRRRPLRRLLDQHPRQPARLGSVHARSRQQSRWSSPFRARARRARRPRHGHVAVLLRHPRRLRQTRQPTPRPRRLRHRRQSHHRPRRHRGLASAPSHRLLEGLRPLPRPRHASPPCSPAAWPPTRSPATPCRESGISQVFLAIDPSYLRRSADRRSDRIAGDSSTPPRRATPIDPAHPVRYPGEQTLHLREENLRLGVPVDPEVWEKYLRTSASLQNAAPATGLPHSRHIPLMKI